MTGTETAPFAFVSSLTSEHAPLRLELFELGQSLDRYVWVCEHPRCRPDLFDRVPLEIADTLIDRVRAARHYFVLLGGARHGTPIAIAERASSVSHFEIELFAAAMAGRKVEVFVAESFSPGPRMSALLTLLAWALPHEQWHGPWPDGKIAAHIERLLRSPVPENLLQGSPNDGLRRRLVARFYRERGLHSRRELLFLDHQFEARAQSPDRDLIDELLGLARHQPDQERKLARLWLALRELMAAPHPEARGRDFLLQWNAALGAWGAAAAWYGLHAHLYLGGRAALGSLVRVRARLREQPPANVEPASIAHPAGALASATYSIAKLAPWRERRALLDEALGHLDMPPASPREESNHAGMRGSIWLRRGHPWRAVEHYRIALRLRESLGDSPARLGESISELGFAYLFTGRFFAGRDLLQQGVTLLTDGDVGFLIRAKKKLACGLWLTGRRDLARRERNEAAQLAHQHRLFDQL